MKKQEKKAEQTNRPLPKQPINWIENPTDTLAQKPSQLEHQKK